MLTNKDYCDKDLSATLMEMGFKGFGHFYYKKDSSELKATFQLLSARTAKALGQTLAVSLYEAQKWLREEKKLIVLVGFDFCPITSEIVYNWVIVANGNTTKKSSYAYDYFEEALLEGIKEAVKILTIAGVEYEPVDTPIQKGMDVSCRECDIYKAKVPRSMAEFPLCYEVGKGGGNARQSCYAKAVRGIKRIWKKVKS